MNIMKQRDNAGHGHARMLFDEAFWIDRLLAIGNFRNASNYAKTSIKKIKFRRLFDKTVVKLWSDLLILYDYAGVEVYSRFHYLQGYH